MLKFLKVLFGGSNRMISFLYIIGIVVFVVGIIAGIMSGSFMGFIIALISGVTSGTIFFALANILENQQSIMSKLEKHEHLLKKCGTQQKLICKKCNYEYEEDCTYCPNCGYRD